MCGKHTSNSLSNHFLSQPLFTLKQCLELAVDRLDALSKHNSKSSISLEEESESGNHPSLGMG